MDKRSLRIFLEGRKHIMNVGWKSESDHDKGPVKQGASSDLKCFWIDCKSICRNQATLVTHINANHVDTRKEDFVCLWHACPRRRRPFNARYKLLIHMRIHTGFKPNQCVFPGCSKSFSRLENLKIHTRSHTGEKPYVCQFCPKGFSNSSDRAKHQRTHFDRKPYACSFGNCTKRYTDPSSLRKHFKLHFKETEIMSPTVSSSSTSADEFTFEFALPLQNLDDLVSWTDTADDDWSLPLDFLEDDVTNIGNFSDLMGL